MIRIVTPPEAEPVGLAEAKLHLRVDTTEEDGAIGRYLEAARIWCEKIQGRAYITRTLELFLDEFPTTNSGLILLPSPPASELVSIKYDDLDDVEQTIDAADYEFDPNSEPARLRPASGLSWPAAAALFSAIRIQWKTGYGDDPTDVPAHIREAIKLKLGDLYENRETVVVGTSTSESVAAEALLAQDRIFEGINE